MHFIKQCGPVLTYPHALPVVLEAEIGQVQLEPRDELGEAPYIITEGSSSPLLFLNL